MKFALVLFAGLLVGCGGGGAATGPTASPTPVPPPSETPAPTPTPVPDGEIVFGTNLDLDTLQVTDPTTEFPAQATIIVWSALLSQPTGAVSVSLYLVNRRASGTENVLHKWDIDTDPTWTTLANNKDDLLFYADYKPGTYVLRILSGTVLLAQGTFTTK